MLVLSRKWNEQLIIGDDITITVVECHEGWVRLGIDAPREVPIHRREVFDAIREQEASSRLTDDELPDPQKATPKR